MATAAFASAAREAHKRQVQSLYKRLLKNSLDWHINREIWREEATQIRAHFEANKRLQNPREIALFLHTTEAMYAEMRHPDPVIPPGAPGGTKWERNIPPPTEEPWDHEAHEEHAEIDEILGELKSLTSDKVDGSLALLESIVNKLEPAVVQEAERSQMEEDALLAAHEAKLSENDRAIS
ncbi:hypothetical protein DL96DRAFT_1553784 [Flagelloscypha sp. PMI_526]|nr:hypothetical protein DL96DRAFT_1553784 [Flagelloscypha sp. PMI_526]